MKNARYYAAKALLKAYKGGYSQLILNETLNNSPLNGKDRAFASSLFYGVTERRVTLDRLISQRCKKKPDEEIRVILQEGFYQLLFMENVPESAVCSESVSLAKEFRKTSAGGFVNGTLRSFIRDGKPLPKGKNKKDSLCLKYSCSEDVLDSFIKWAGEEKTERAFSESFERAPVFIRPNTLRINSEELKKELLKEGIETEDTSLENCLKVKKGDIAHTKAFKEGLFTVSDIMSQRCALSLGVKKGERVLDLCSAPGTKSFIMAECMENEGSITSCDLSEGRLKLVDEGKDRLGIKIIETKVNDGSILREEWLNSFDKILCDVPCSGLGVIRRKPELKYRNKEDYEDIHILQYEILKNASKYLKKGGRLIYSTCTVNPSENEDNVKRFLEENPDFEGFALGEDGFIIKNFVGEKGGDGFFIAGLEKR